MTTATAATVLDKDHHPDCHYDALYCDGRLCWEAAAAQQRAIRTLARYDERPYCGLPCDGNCDELREPEPEGPTAATEDKLQA